MGKPAPLYDRLKGCIAAHPDWDDNRVARAIRGSTLAVVTAVRAGDPIAPVIEEAKKVEAGTISLDVVRKRYDVATAIRAELARLKPGALILEREFCQRVAGKDAARFRRTVENTPEFRANRVKLRLADDAGEGAWYWADAKTVTEAVRLRDE